MVTATTHTLVGNYTALKKAHLNHEEEKYNSNEDIDYELAYLNEHKLHMSKEDFANFYYEKYEQPIEQYNQKQEERRQYNRMFKDFDEYKEKQKNSGRRQNSKKEKDENRLTLFAYGSKEDTDKIIKQFKQAGFSKEDVLKAMGNGLNDHIDEFNSKHTNMTITEHFNHLNEGYVHSHCNLYAFGKDKFNKPFYDINQALQVEYGGTKYKYDKHGNKQLDKNGKPKEFKKSISDIWKDFRDDTDRSIVDHVNTRLVELAKTKDFDFKPPKFERKEVEEVGKSHEKHKAAKQKKERKQELLNNLEQVYNTYWGRNLKEDAPKINKKSEKYIEKNLTHIVGLLGTKVEELTDKNNELTDKNDELTVKNEELTTQNQELERINQERQNTNTTLKSENEALTNKNNLLKTEQAQLNEFQKDKYKNLMAYHLYEYQQREYEREGRKTEFYNMLDTVRDINRVNAGASPLKKSSKGRTFDY
ncbi:hypothetical protein [Staphylococcus aureus]|uniref:hypothetical protein n=1 Tax=Staphylococcus aureus TaxID=1280 RepID=UPI002270921A|nr:hypothetical protein [Staphylococcus aureus]